MDQCPTCKKDSTSFIKCRYCKRDSFCSENCQALGWSVHQDGCNIITTPWVAMTEYIGEDMMNKNELDRLKETDPVLQSHLVRSIDPKGGYVQYEVASRAKMHHTSALSKLPYGEKPSKEIRDKKYSLLVRNGSKEFEIDNLDLRKNAIYQGAEGRAGQLATDLFRFGRQGGRIVLWPEPEKIPKGFEIDHLEPISVTLVFDGEPLGTFEGEIVANRWFTTKKHGTKRRFAPTLNTDRTVKFGGTRYKNAKLAYFKGKSPDNGMILKITTESTSVYTLIDLELSVYARDLEAQSSGSRPLPPVPARTKIPFVAHPDSLEHVSALVMALEEQIALGNLPQQHQNLAIINTHRLALESAMLKSETIPAPTPKINAAVQNATCALLIGNRSRQKSYLEKITESSNSPAMAMQLASELRDKMLALRNKKSRLNSALKRAVKLKILDLQKAILTVQRQSGLAKETKQQYQNILDQVISKALDPLASEKNFKI
jgi:hypothetical protein